MNIHLFNKTYTVRTFGGDEVTDGYASASYTDATCSIDVQPLTNDDLRALPEGERNKKRIKAYSEFPFKATDELTGVRGDWLLYEGKWYECISSLWYEHTILSHYNSEFVEVGVQHQSD